MHQTEKSLISTEKALFLVPGTFYVYRTHLLENRRVIDKASFVNCIFYYMRISCSIPVRASFTLFRKEHEYVRALLLLAAIKHESLAIVAAQTTTFRSESG